ncbi:MAG TPA: gamma-glutamyltransferase family protein [Anaerolineaceae bacterium]
MTYPELLNIPFITRRSPVYGRKGMVAASQPLAVMAGIRILEQGGTAADAAVAVAAALNVTEPNSTGLGGDFFALYYENASRKVYALNGSGRAPAALNLKRLQAEGLGDSLPPTHPYTVTVPGACAGWCDLVDRFGSLPLAKIFAPAMDLAEGGFPVAPLTAYFWQRSAGGLLKNAINGFEMTIDGRGPRAGEIFRNPGLARSLWIIAEQGKAGYYQGEIGAAVAAAVQQAGGCMQVSDLEAHTSTWEQPIRASFHGVDIWECPPNGQGLAALLALNLLAGFDLASLPPLSAERLHLEIEALRLGFTDARYYVADPAVSPAPLAGLLSPAYAEERRKLIHPRRANPDLRHGTPPASSDTVYFCTVDGAGNACSVVNSNYMGFGTGIVPHGFGFTLQNRGHNFSLDASHPNALAPGKRPYHTIIPAMATYTENQALYGPFGVMGGFMQPQGHTQVAIGLVLDGYDPQTALDQPRFCIEVDGDGQVAVEEGIPDATLSELEAMGHRLRPVSGVARSLFGRGQIIRRDPASGVLAGGSDGRADGFAAPVV